MEKVRVNSQQEMINKHCLSNHICFNHFYAFTDLEFEEFYTRNSKNSKKHTMKGHFLCRIWSISGVPRWHIAKIFWLYWAFLDEQEWIDSQKTTNGFRDETEIVSVLNKLKC